MGDQYLLVACTADSAFAHVDGQHVAVTFVDAEGSFARFYSIASSHADREIEFCVRLGIDGRASVCWEGVNVGTSLTVTAPKGRFKMVQTEAPVVLVAGGSGIAPLRAMLRGYIAAGRQLKHPITMIYGCADADVFPYADELQELARAQPAVTVRLIAGRGSRAGVVGGNIVEAVAASVDPSAKYYLCGPKPMVAAAREQLTSRGVPAEALFDEGYG